MRFLKFFVRECVSCGCPIENGGGTIRCLECRKKFRNTARRCLQNMVAAVAKYGDRFDDETQFCRQIIGLREMGKTWPEIVDSYG